MKTSKTKSELSKENQEKDMVMVSGMLRNEDKKIQFFVYSYDALTNIVERVVKKINSIRSYRVSGYNEDDNNYVKLDSYNFTSFDTTKEYFFDYKQDCFIHLYQKDWEKLKKYNPAKHYFRPWLSVVVYRIFSKRKGDRATIVSKKVDIDNAICDYIDLSVIDIGKMDKIADNEIGSEMIKKVLKKKLEYQTNGTIAEELGIPPKKVSECLNRGIALLIGLGFEDYFEKKH